MIFPRLISAIFVAVALASPALAEDAAGKWTGTLYRPAGEVPIDVAIVRGADGRLAGTAEAPSGSTALEKVSSDGALLTFELPQGSGGCKMTWNDKDKTWAGVLKQDGADMIIELHRKG